MFVKRCGTRISLESINSKEVRSEIYNPEISNSSQDQISEAIPSQFSGFSEFSETDCYEPVSAQYLRIDFTPNEDDDEYQLQKCSDFWKYIGSVPEIQHLKVHPQKSPEIHQEAKEKTQSKSSSVSSKTKDGAVPGEAVAMLKIIQDKGLADQTFVSGIPPKYCPESSSKVDILDDTQRKKKKKSGPSIRARCPCKCEPLPQPRHVSQVSQLKSMVKEMQEWDAKHPRSMEPPGLTPTLQHCVLTQGKSSKRS